MASGISLIAANLVERIGALMPSAHQRHCLALAQNLLAALNQEPVPKIDPASNGFTPTDGDKSVEVLIQDTIARLSVEYGDTTHGIKEPSIDLNEREIPLEDINERAYYKTVTD